MMSFRFSQHESVEEGLKRIAHEQVSKAIGEVTDEQLDSHEKVHQVRKRCKKLRGLIRLLRPHFEDTYEAENEWYRDAARELSFVRDAQSLVETYDELTDHFADQIDKNALASIRRQLVERRKRIAQDEVGLQNRLDEFAIKMRQGRDRIDSWTIDAKEFEAIEDGLANTYDRGRRARQAAYSDPSPEKFHEWRKRAKYHWYHTRLLKPIWPEVMKKHRNEVHLLSDYLGDDHDLAVFRQTLVHDAGQFGQERDIQTLLGLIDRRRLELETKARPLGRRIFFEKPKRLAARLGCYWNAWRAEQVTPATLRGHVALHA